MPATLLNFGGVGFNNGGAGFVYNFGGAGAPAVGQVDVLCINSNTVVNTPAAGGGASWQVGEDAVANQGSYIFFRKATGSEPTTVTITTSGDHDTEVQWERWSGIDAFLAGNNAQANNTNGVVLPALSTGALPGANTLVIAFAALHNFDAALATAPVWSNGFTAIDEQIQGSPGSSTAVVGFTAYQHAGPSAVQIDSVTWTNNARNRYALYATFSTISVTGSAVTGTASVELPTLSAAATGEVLVDGDVEITLPTLSFAASGAVSVDGELAIMLPTLSFAATGTNGAEGELDITLPTLSFAASGDVGLGGELDILLPTLSFAASGGVDQDAEGDLVATLPDLEVDLVGNTQVIDIFSQSFAVVTGIGMCIAEDLDRTEWGRPDRVCLAVPGEIAWDDCQCGQFAQSITQDVPSENFPIAATDRRVTACGPAHLVVSVTASIARCVTGINRRDGRPPTCEELLNDARRLEDDRKALRLGVTCCLLELWQANVITAYTVGAATTVGPQGGCVGVELTYQFGLRNVCCGVD